MNRFTVLTFLCLCTSFLSLFSQNCEPQRYLQPIFEVERLADVPYGKARAIIFPPYISENTGYEKNLRADVYLPKDDSLRKRPLIIMAFGGGFLFGNKEQEELVAFCENMASRGFVAAAIDYRLGYNTFNEWTASRAMYRATQDMNAAVRFFKGQAAAYGIDTAAVFTGGNSAGAMTAIQAAYTEPWERDSLQWFEPTFEVARTLAPDWPDLGCLTCSGDDGSFGYQGSTEPRAVINLWGAIGEMALISGNGLQPMISFYGDEDRTVNPNMGAPFNLDALFPSFWGSIPIHARLDSLGVVNQVYHFPTLAHEVWIDADTAAFIQQKTAEFLYGLLQPAVPTLHGPAVSHRRQIDTFYTSGAATSRFCWEVEGGSVVSPVMDGTSIEVFWHTTGTGAVRVRQVSYQEIMSDWASQEVEVLHAVARAQQADAGLLLYPNPASGAVWLSFAQPIQIEAMWLVDLRGNRLPLPAGHTARQKISVEGFAAGMYVLVVKAKDGRRWRKKLLIR